MEGTPNFKSCPECGNEDLFIDTFRKGIPDDNEAVKYTCQDCGWVLTEEPNEDN